MSRKKPIEIQIGQRINVEPEGIYRSEVVKAGNGAMIKFYKRFIGQKVIIVLVKKMK